MSREKGGPCKRDAVTPDGILVNGLKRLEYRGYDSSGVAIAQDGEIAIYKKQGMVVAMEEHALANNTSGKIKVFDILEKIGFGDGFGPCFEVIVAPSWRQVGSKGGFGGFENEFKKNMKKRSRNPK